MQRQIVQRQLTNEGALLSKHEGNGRSVAVNLAESPLTWLHARGLLDDRRFAAGELLRRDWEAAQLSPQITMRWDPVRIKGSGGERGLSPSERQVAAKTRFDGAIAAAGSGLTDILWRVVCAGEGLPVAERALGWPARSAKLVLGLALDRVADYYRINGVNTPVP